MSELFDEVESYDDMLQRGLSLSGESKEFFIRGRLEHLRRRLGDRRVSEREAPIRILDFGCGVGDAAGVLAEAFPGASVVGVDVAEAAVEKANATRSSEGVAFGTPVL
ncbi:MAG: methyltransferase domain-containing protein, partial [Acidimicrobiia bacterium]|nr:methyltransferase domain-containing protein [Acidimicrobiia bacterium]